ncbi:IclR family transcriptional regulator [Streptomyces hoynatensis]|uniref:IclR family transcriptional regulator n=1 Tax=Streptomyces hoynatensis TaxID=1141874 RepID=A0A3A9Z6R4_9ACTN|nr:IclR family transcriptional regulator [Streptomyces hoynatensis]RKN43995.1 IclR family transcriptional regulator [Streptomyces hoynatensis]
MSTTSPPRSDSRSRSEKPGRQGRPGPGGQAGQPGQQGVVGALRKGLEILDLYSRERQEIGIGEMAEALGIHKSSASRLAATLAGSGYLKTAHAPGTYRLGPRLAALGEIAGSRAGLAEIVMPHLEELVAATGETGHLAVLEGAEASTVGVADGWHTVRMHSWVGKRSPAHCSSMGKALLAGLGPAAVRELLAGAEPARPTANTLHELPRLLDNLESLRSGGFGLDDEELEYGLRCVSAPVFSADGTVDASISISGPTQRITHARVPRIAEHVRWHAWRASQARGAVRVPEGWAPPPAAPPAPLDWLPRER